MVNILDINVKADSGGLDNITSEFDYVILHDRVKEYHFPRNRIGSLIKSGKIIRVKKGIYIKSGENFSKFCLANMIYGPSYVSEDSALSHWGLIPERVETVTSTSISRKRSYSTPIGVFQFNPAQSGCYAFGVRRVEIDEQRSFLIASPEKAIFDRLLRVRGLESTEAMREYLFENMRIDEPDKFDLRQLNQLVKLSGKTFVKTLVKVLKEECPDGE